METTTHVRYLTEKQQLFCDEYLLSMNASAAALKAGYSETTARNGALMRMPKIRMYLDEKRRVCAARLQVSQEMMLNELAKIAFGNMGNYFGDDGKVKPMNELDDDQKAALWQVKTDADGTVNIKTYNKLVALEKIAKIMQFYKPQVIEPQPTAMYVDRFELTEDDCFEDESFEAYNENNDNNEPVEFADTDGSPLYENGIDYGPAENIFEFFMQDEPDMMMSKLTTFEEMEACIKEYAEAKGSNAFESMDIKFDLAAWLQKELLKCGVEASGCTPEDIDNQFRMLRNLRVKHVA